MGIHLNAQISDKKKNQKIDHLIEKYQEEFGKREVQEKYSYRYAPTRSGTGEEIKVTNFNELIIEEAEPTIAVNPTNPDNIVVSFIHRQSGFPISGQDSGSSAYYSFDGGNTWSRSYFNQDSIYQLDHDENPNLEIRGGADPVFAFDNSGRLYCVWLYGLLDAAIQGFFITTYWGWSDDGGMTFQVAEEQADRLLGSGSIGNNGITGVTLDRPWLAVDKSDGPNSGTVYIQADIAWSPPGNPIFEEPFWGSGILYKSPDMTGFEVRPDPINDFAINALDFQLQFANLHVDHQGVLHSSFSSLDAGQAISVYHLTSSDAGESFEMQAEAADSPYSFQFQLTPFRENPMPDAVTHPISGNISMVFGTRGSDSLSYQGQYIKSLNGGETWSTPQEISTMINADVSALHYPTIAIDEVSGRMSISYLGRDSDSTWNYYVTSSIDDGENWDEPCLLSTSPTNFDPYFSNPIFFGDYWETKMVGDKTYCVWNDGRNGNGSKIYFGLVDHNEAVNVSELTSLTDQIQIQEVSPNPTSGELNLKLNAQTAGKIYLDLISIDGTEISFLKEENILAGNQNIQLKLADHLSEGSYILRIQTDFGLYTRKVVIVR